MPIYEYQCERCGVFSVMRKMSEANENAVCTECKRDSPRILSAPRLAVLSAAQRAAHSRNERAAHEPKTAKRSSCGCGSTHTCKPATKAEQQPQGLQMQTKRTARPWMVGH